MANFKVCATLISIGMVLNLVSSLPAPVDFLTSLSTGARIGADATTATNSAITSATRAANDLASTATQAAAAGANAVPVITNAATTGANAVSAAARPATTNAIAAAAGAAGTASQIASAVGGGTGTLAGASSAGSTASSLVPGALSLGLGAFSPLGLFQPQSDLTSVFRNGVSGLVNYADRGTGLVSNGVRAAATGAGGLVDGGLAAVGLQQPIAAPTAEAVWRVSEGGRNTGFAILRRGLDGSLYIIDPLVSQPLRMLDNVY